MKTMENRNVPTAGVIHNEYIQSLRTHTQVLVIYMIYLVRSIFFLYDGSTGIHKCGSFLNDRRSGITKHSGGIKARICGNNLPALLSKTSVLSFLFRGRQSLERIPILFKTPHRTS